MNVFVCKIVRWDLTLIKITVLTYLIEWLMHWFETKIESFMKHTPIIEELENMIDWTENNNEKNMKIFEIK